MTRISVYLIDDDDDFRASLKQALELAGISVADFNRPEKALEQMDEAYAGVIISDVKMAGMDGLQFLMEASEIDEDIPIILVSGHADVSTAVQAIQDGAYDLLEKPFRTQNLIDVVRRAQEKRKLVLENRRLRAQLNRPRKSLVLGDSNIIRELRGAITRHAPSQANILISGVKQRDEAGPSSTGPARQQMQNTQTRLFSGLKPVSMRKYSSPVPQLIVARLKIAEVCRPD